MGYRGRVKNGTVVVDEPLPLPEGTEVTIAPAEQPATMPGSGGAAEALRGLAGLFPAEDIEEIERALRECRKVDPNGW